MNHSRNRRAFLLAAVSVPIGTVWTSWATQGNATLALTKLECTLAGRLGVFALNTAKLRFDRIDNPTTQDDIIVVPDCRLPWRNPKLRLIEH
jgi:hypothetical protein